METQIKNQELLTSVVANLAVEEMKAQPGFNTKIWEKEISGLIENTTNAADKKALIYFSEAMKPLLKNPEQLKTLLGKIAML